MSHFSQAAHRTEPLLAVALVQTDHAVVLAQLRTAGSSVSPSALEGLRAFTRELARSAARQAFHALSADTPCAEAAGVERRDPP